MGLEDKNVSSICMFLECQCCIFCVTQGVYGQLSEYELERLEKIRQNQAFLSSISLLQVHACFCLISSRIDTQTSDV